MTWWSQYRSCENKTKGKLRVNSCIASHSVASEYDLTRNQTWARRPVFDSTGSIDVVWCLHRSSTRVIRGRRISIPYLFDSKRNQSYLVDPPTPFGPQFESQYWPRRKYIYNSTPTLWQSAHLPTYHSQGYLSYSNNDCRYNQVLFHKWK